MKKIERYRKVTIFKASERAIELGLIWDDILAQGEYVQVNEIECPGEYELDYFMNENYPQYTDFDLYFWVTR